MKFNELWNKQWEKKSKKHTNHDWWKTVRKRRSDAKADESVGALYADVGVVLKHTLNEQGKVHFYDVQWPDGVVEEGIPASSLIPEKRQKHKH